MGPAREARLSARLLRLFTGASHGFPHRPWARSVQGAACAAIYGQRKGKEKMTQELIPDPRAHASTVADMMQRAAELNEGKEVANVRMHREQLAVIVAALRAYAVPECGTRELCASHADAWYTSRNHLHGGMEQKCVVCAFVSARSLSKDEPC